MLIGYVSDENYTALEGVAFEIVQGSTSGEARSRVTGAVHADISPGVYNVTLTKPGYGSKRVQLAVDPNKPYQFRLLSDGLLGYVWPKWSRTGQSAQYRVHSTEAYKLELWRYGWEKELVHSFGWLDDHGKRATAQIVPDGDFTRTGVEWNKIGYGRELQRQLVTAPEKSGLYFFHASTESGEFFSFPWIVSPTEPQAKIAVLTSNITWNAYNDFGGRSNYYTQAGLDPQPTVNPRQDLGRYTQPDTWPFEETGAPLSFERPEPASSVPQDGKITDPIRGRLGSAFAPGEWRLLGWMEREGFDYDLYSEVELHFDRIPLDDYKVLVLNTHPEYWSKEMYFRVKEWVHERGGKLMYLAGCGLYAEVEFPDEQTMLCRIEGKTDHRQESEANLLGIAYTHSGFQTGAPYRVLDDSHWAFEKTGLKNGDLFGFRSLHERCPGGASAHELDKIVPESPPNLQHLAKGDNPDETGADLVCYETPSGGGVFSAGSLCWTLSIAVDDGISAVTANVLNRFLR